MKNLIKIILREETQGVDQFLEKIASKHPDINNFKNEIKQSLINSNCKKIEFMEFGYPAMGLALHDGLYINSTALNLKLPMLLFVLFHEVAHQYQYKKYGAEKMYEFYNREIPIKEAVDFMRKVELVADEFGSRKVREFQNKGYIDKNFVPPKVYASVPDQFFGTFISNLRNEMESKNVSSPTEISELIYNKIKKQVSLLDRFF